MPQAKLKKRIKPHALPYGAFLLGDGTTYVLFDRSYRLIAKCTGIEPAKLYGRDDVLWFPPWAVEPITENVFIEHFDAIRFYSDRTTPTYNQATRAHLRKMVERSAGLVAELNRRT